MTYSNGQSKQKIQYYGFLLWFLGALFFFCEYLLRVSPSVMVDDLTRYYNASALGIGAFSSFFYYPYILMQIPVGSITDRYGVRTTLTFATLVCACACLLFVMVHSIQYAILARALMGFSAAFAFVGTLRIAIDWFDAKHFALLAGCTQGLGMLGAAMGDAPMAWYADHFGFYNALFGFVFLFFGLGLLMLLLLRSKSKQNAVPTVKTPIVQGLKQVIKVRALWWNCLYIGMLYAPTTVFAESWGVNYLTHHPDVTRTMAALIVSMIFLGLFIGCPLLGYLNRYFKTLYLMRICPLICLMLLSLILYADLHSWIVWAALCFIYGIFNSAIVISYAYAATLIDQNVSGIALGITNMASVFFGAILIQLVGVILVWCHYSNFCAHGLMDYKLSFSLLLLSLMISFLSTFKMKI